MAREWLKVESYWLRYEVEDGKCQVGIRFRDTRGSEEVVRKKGFTVATGHALFLSDLLRNESPVYWNPITGVIATSETEPVGEGE